MSGIMVAVAGGTQNVIYANGLYNSSTGVDTSPVTFSASSIGGSTLNYNYTWTGYYKPATTGTVTLGLTTNYAEYLTSFGAYNWGGGGYSIGYLWLGNTAKSGYNTGNANITANDTTATYSPSLIAGIYYPIRINLLMSLPYSANIFGDFYDGYAEGSFSFLSGGSTGVSGLIWYNSLSNGF